MITTLAWGISSLGGWSGDGSSQVLGLANMIARCVLTSGFGLNNNGQNQWDGILSIYVDSPYNTHKLLYVVLYVSLGWQVIKVGG